ISNGIVKGYADGSFKPNNPVTRAELSKMLSVAMAVAGVQKAETDPRISTMYAAQVLIDSLPGDQDKATTEALYERLNALNGGDNVRFIEEKEPNDSRPKANIITLKNDGESYFKLFGTITSDIFDVDFFKFTLLHDSLVEILGYWASDEVYNQGFEDDLRICLYSARGDLVLDSDLAYSDDLDLEAFRYIQEHLTAGTYYIEVTTYGYEDTYVDKYYSINLGIFPD
ncbi:MAG: S-layer homology domain-containing protein, partial [Clostridiales bacterium]|nr:S-layer homology domain-containing protein [Clostridiales bacterium]